MKDSSKKTRFTEVLLKILTDLAIPFAFLIISIITTVKLEVNPTDSLIIDLLFFFIPMKK